MNGIMGEAGRPEELIDRHLKLQTATGNIATALGTLALLWSTVVLLGGFVTALRIKEFWLLTALSFLMAFRIVDTAKNEIRRKGIYMEEREILDIVRRQKWIKAPCYVFMLRMVLVTKWIFAGFFVSLFTFSPIVSVGIALWRLGQRDYGNAGGDAANSAKLNGALDIFYALILLQSLFAFYFLLLILAEDEFSLVKTMCERYGLVQEWGSRFVRNYYLETEKKINDGKLPDNWNLITYCVELLQSASGDNDQLWGTRALGQLLDTNADDMYVRQKLLTSRLSIHNLIAMLRDSTADNNDIEIRERATRIVAHLASDLHITQFPGTLLKSICSLLESCKQCYPEPPQVVTCPSSSESNSPDGEQQRLPDPDKKDPLHGSSETVVVVPIQDQTTDHELQPAATFWERIKKDREVRRQRKKAAKESRYTYESRGAKELVSQGLLILEGLTRDEGNCEEISKDQRLLAKVTSPLSNHDFLSYARDDTMVALLSKSLTVVSRLLASSPGDGATRLRQKLATDMAAVNNLMCVLETDSKGARQMHEQALEILTELAFDGYLKQQDFVLLFNALHNNAIAPEPKNADREKATRLRGKAGEALARLLPLGIAAGIIPQQNAISLLTKVLDQIISSKMGRTAYATTGEAEADSEKPATQGNEKQSEERKFMSGMLFLAMVIIRNENVISSEEDFRRASLHEDAALVKKLKEILGANAHSTAVCLMIVKLTCQVVIAMIQVNPSCIKHFDEHRFKEALTEALGTMLEVDDCMLFAGNDREVIKSVRSLASLVKEAQELMTLHENRTVDISD